MLETIKIIDNTHYNPDFCNNGGAYSFTTVFTPTEDGYTVTYETSSEFPYCPLCGSFYTGECPCCMEDPDVVDREAVNKAISDALQKVAHGENWEIVIE